MAYSIFLPEISSKVRSMPPRIPQAAHRHAAPSGPWPWADLVEDSGPFVLKPSEKNSSDSENSENSGTDFWRRYPSNLFPNWNSARVGRSGIGQLIHKKPDTDCIIYHTDMTREGQFSQPGEFKIREGNEGEFWNMMKDRGSKNRARILFVENLSGGVLQMLGTMFKIEPFFFSSSLNWIPSRYREDVRQNEGDHITITLTFLRTMENPMTVPNTPTTGESLLQHMISRAATATIDTQAPLILRSNDRILLVDLLAFHMVRRKDGSTIISYHPAPEWKRTSARYLSSRVRIAGESVYWQSLFRNSEDPTLVMLCMLWYALYAWDEALDNLYIHICWLESRVLVTNDIHLTRELHIIRASLLHYASLLESFRKAVLFIRNDTNPAMQDSPDLTKSTPVMNRECDTLLSEIERLGMFRKMQEKRLENVINLAFASVNFDDSRYMQRLSEAAFQDGAAMKQISYLTMIFLPGSFVAALFGMNINSLQDSTHGTWAHYLEFAIPLTAVTIWIVVSLHSNRIGGEEPGSLLYRLQWPIHSVKRLITHRRAKAKDFEGVV